MNTTLTIRLPEENREALRKRAQAFKKTESEFVRELIARETASVFEFENIRHLVGRVRISGTARKTDAWREHLRKANWRK